MRRRVATIAISAVLASVVWAQSSGPEPTALPAAADALVDTWYGGNVGAGNAIGVDAGRDGGRKMYLKFDLSKAPFAIRGARLELRVVGGTKGFDTFNVFGVIDGPGDMWVEGAGTSNKKKPDSSSAATSAPSPTSVPVEEGINSANAPANNPKSGGGRYDIAKKTGGGVDNSKAVFLGTFTVDNTGYALSRRKGTVTFGSQGLSDFLAADTNKLVTLIITREAIDYNTSTSFGTREGGTPAVLKVSAEPMVFPAQPSPPEPEQPGAGFSAAITLRAEPAGQGLTYVLDGRPVVAADVPQALEIKLEAVRAAGAESMALSIHAEPDVPFAAVAALMEQAAKLGIKEMRFSVTKPAAPVQGAPVKSAASGGKKGAKSAGKLSGAASQP